MTGSPGGNSTLTALPGVRVGHATRTDQLTGATVVVFDRKLPVVYRCDGGDAGTFNTDSLRPTSVAYGRHALFVAGGSLAGLMGAAPLMRSMIDAGLGDRDGAIVNPVVSGAVIFDQGCRLGPFDPDLCQEAFERATGDPVESGNVGAGTGATVGKFQWLADGTLSGGMKAGVGSARAVLGTGVQVCAMSVVNALGNVVGADGAVLAGNRAEDRPFLHFDDCVDTVTGGANTTVTVVGTDAALGAREHYDRVAQLACHGQIRAVDPVHTSQDGDTLFLFSTERTTGVLGERGALFDERGDGSFAADVVGHVAAKVVRESIYDACRAAVSVCFDGAYGGRFPAARDYP